MLGSFPDETLRDFYEAYAEKILELPSGKYEVKVGKEGVSLVPAGYEPKSGAELPAGAKNKNVSGKRMTSSGASGRVKGAEASLAKASNPGAKAAAQKNLNSARIS